MVVGPVVRLPLLQRRASAQPLIWGVVADVHHTAHQRVVEVPDIQTGPVLRRVVAAGGRAAEHPLIQAQHQPGAQRAENPTDPYAATMSPIPVSMAASLSFSPAASRSCRPERPVIGQFNDLKAGGRHMPVATAVSCSVLP